MYLLDSDSDDVSSASIRAKHSDHVGALMHKS